MADALWGPWQMDLSGGFWWRQGVSSSTNGAANEDPSRNPQPEPTPELPERMTPLACEHVVMSDRRNEQARKLIDSVFGTSEGGQ